MIPSVPHSHTVPSERSARLSKLPADTCVTPVNPVTWTGVRDALLLAVPLPSWPKKLLPQAHTVPSECSARLCSPPADTWVTPVPDTSAGVAMFPPQKAASCQFTTGHVIAWAGADAPTTRPARPSVSVAHPTRRASHRDPCRAFIVLPPNRLSAAAAAYFDPTEAGQGGLIHRVCSERACHNEP